MNKKLRVTDPNEQDRLSSLPDEVIHQILSFLGTRLAVQTSILSKRWKRIWTSFPFFTFDGYDQLFPYTHSSIFKFIDHVLSNRNHETPVFFFKFFAVYPFPPSFVKRLIKYPIEHNVEEMDVDLDFHRYHPFKLSTFSSNTIRKLKLRVPLDFGESLGSDCEWVLPVLKTLHLICPPHVSNYELPEFCLICVPTLTTLCLDGVMLPESLSSISLPLLTTLSMKRCKLPEKVWDFPALLSLELDGVLLPENMSDYFSALFNVRDITLYFRGTIIQDCIISCPQLMHLKIGTSFSTSVTRNRRIVVVAPRLCKLYCIGIFVVILNVHELENVSIKLWDTNEFKNATWAQKKQHYRRYMPMFSKLGSAKVLTLDSAMIEALSTISVFFERVPSPFKNLKYVKLPQGYKESSISTTLRKYLIGGNPRATIVTMLPQSKLNHQVVLNSSTSQKVCVDTVEKRVQVEHLVQNSVDADKVRQVGCLVSGTGTGNDQASSFRGNGDFGLWQGHEVNSEFLGLLDLIMKNYPETFEHFTAKSERFYTTKLNMVCTSVKDFLRISMTEFTSEIITEYRDLFVDMQKWGFNVNWLVSHLNYIEQLWFAQGLHPIDSEIDDAILDLHAFCLEKMT